MVFLFNVNVYVFIPMVLFHGQKLLKWGFYLVLSYMYLFSWCFFIAKNCQKWGFYLVLMHMYLFQ